LAASIPKILGGLFSTGIFPLDAKIHSLDVAVAEH
jgi:hypothetical protein